jgi:large subunit ribosomal protein L18
MNRTDTKRRLRVGRQQRIRRKITGTGVRPRLCVYKGNKNITAQLVDDSKGTILAAASSFGKELKGKLKAGGNAAAASEVGKLLASKAVAAGIKKVVFDRGGNKFHGRIKALAEAARAGGLEF